MSGCGRRVCACVNTVRNLDIAECDTPDWTVLLFLPSNPGCSRPGFHLAVVQTSICYR